MSSRFAIAFSTLLLGLLSLGAAVEAKELLPHELDGVTLIEQLGKKVDPGLRFTVYSRTSEEILTLLENLEIEAGLSYLDNEPVGRSRTVPLYRERYRLLTTADGPLGDRSSVTWREVGEVPLGLLPPDMQNRRIVDRLLRGAGAEPDPILESNSVIVLAAHVRAGGLATVLPERLAATLLVDAEVKSIPITEPEAVHTIGLIVPVREPATAMAAALLTEARRLSEALDKAG